MTYFKHSTLFIFIFIFIFISIFLMTVQASTSLLPAFPTAEGFGAISKGGRNGTVIRVTNLNSNGPGSLQQAAGTKGARIIIFTIAGVIRSDIHIKYSNITIAGQSAPSPGITIEGRIKLEPQSTERLHDIVIRFLRIRQKPTSGHTGDVIQLPKADRIILDHLSLAWGNDELIDIIHSSNVTVQWCTLEESDPAGHSKGVAHNFALLSAYPGSGNISIHHNLFAHNSKRNPSLSPYVEGQPADFRNNIIYNFQEGLGHDGHIPKAGINIIGNYYKLGPNTQIITPYHFSSRGMYYLKDNYLEGIGEISYRRESVLSDKKEIKFFNIGVLSKHEFPVAPVKTEASSHAYNKVLKFAGSFPRDRITKRTLNEVYYSTGDWKRNAPNQPSDEWFLYGIPKEELTNDSDGDGMDDNWEIAVELNPNKYDANFLMDSDYTAIESYLNYRADLLLKNQRKKPNEKVNN